MPAHRLLTPALVMRKMDFRETSRLVWLFTREAGLLTALARGAHRPGSRFQGALDLFFLLDVELSTHPAREIQLLAEAAVREAHRPLGRSPRRLAAASILVEGALGALPEGRPDPPLFDLLIAGLALVCRFPASRLEVAVRAWQQRFLDLLGQGLALDRCALCGTALTVGPSRPVPFSVAAGGLLCPGHPETPAAPRLPGGVALLLRAFRLARAADLARLPVAAPDLGQAGRILDEALARGPGLRSRALPVLAALQPAAKAGPD